MAGDNKPALVALRDRRAWVIERLSDAFAHDVLDLDEFEQRLTIAHQTDSVQALEKLIEDLQPAEPSADQALATQPSEDEAPETAMVEHRSAKKKIVAIFSGAERKGSWRASKKITAVAVFGGVTLDFREVQLPPGVTEVSVTAIMGGVDIIVPPSLAVECDGWAIMGGFDDMDRAPVKPDPNQPLLVIKGRAIMGGFDITTRLPGESGWQAFRRKRSERKQLRKREQKKLKEEQRKQLDE